VSDSCALADGVADTATITSQDPLQSCPSNVPFGTPSGAFRVVVQGDGGGTIPNVGFSTCYGETQFLRCDLSVGTNDGNFPIALHVKLTPSTGSPIEGNAYGTMTIQ